MKHFEIKEYRPLHVEGVDAVYVPHTGASEEQLQELMSWCGGQPLHDEPEGKVKVKSDVKREGLFRLADGTVVLTDSFIVKRGDGTFTTMRYGKFCDRFEEDR